MDNYNSSDSSTGAINFSNVKIIGGVPANNKLIIRYTKALLLVTNGKFTVSIDGLTLDGIDFRDAGTIIKLDDKDNTLPSVTI